MRYAFRIQQPSRLNAYALILRVLRQSSEVWSHIASCQPC